MVIEIDGGFSTPYDSNQDLVSEVKLVCSARQGKDKKTERGGGTSAASKDNRGLTKVRSGGTSIRWVL